MECPTVQIQLAPSADNPTGVVIINESDYDAATMQLVGGEPPAPPAPIETQQLQALTTSDVKVLNTAEVAALSVVAPPWANK